MTALHYAAKHGQLHIVKWLVDKDADLGLMDVYGFTAFIHAVRAGQSAVAKWFVQTGYADLETNGLTLLHMAAGDGDIELVKWLVEEPPSVDVKGKTGYRWTALHFSASKGKLEVVRYLMRTGKAGVDAKNKAELTAAHLPARSHHWDVVEELLEVWDGDPRERDAEGRNVWDFAKSKYYWPNSGTIYIP